MTSYPSAILALADGTIFHGKGVGASGSTVGELVFNTSLSAYQEVLTDPSSVRQIVTFTYPHIGNTGVNEEDSESGQVHAAGLVLRELPVPPSNFRLTQTLPDWLRAQQLVAIAGLDTRKLTRLLRERGAQQACIRVAEAGEQVDTEFIDGALAQARAAQGLAGADLSSTLSCTAPYDWSEGEWVLGQGYQTPEAPRFDVVVYDFGVKRSILRLLAARGCRVRVVPASTPAAEVLALKPQGVFLSNGGGDPQASPAAVDTVKALLASGVPLFGIGFGHQLLALASGARTFKLKAGHHGANHPVRDLASGQVWITSQNHSFAVDGDSLPACLRATQVSLFDGSNQGLERTDLPAFSCQAHPGSGPGPRALDPLFERFTALMQATR